jgi:hypothetical protein
MDVARLSLTLEFGALLGLILALLLPFVFVPGTGVVTYYSWWAAGPRSIGVLAFLMAFVILLHVLNLIAAETLAGFTLGFGFAMLFVALAWALLVPHHVVLGVPTVREFTYHRWVVVLFAAMAFGASLWYTRAVLTAGRRPKRPG